MKNFRKEQVLSQKQLEIIRSEVTSRNVTWGRPRLTGTHAGQHALYLYEMIPLPGETKKYENHKTNPFIIESSVCKHFTNTLTFLKSFAKERGELCRIVIFNLKETSDFSPHADLGAYYKIRDRYHLVIVSEGSFMRSGIEEYILKEGELWWFNNKEIHYGKNMSSKKPRIHIVFDILPKGTESIPERFLRKFLNVILLWRYKLINNDL